MQLINNTEVTMNQNEVRAQFKEEWADAVAHNPRLATDKPAKSLAFGMLLDSLCRAGQITDKQYNNMTMERSKTRTTVDEFDVEQQFPDGWEIVCSEPTRKLARARVKDYRANQPQFDVRIVKRRVKIGAK
jgi:uncharacterized protein (DUF924 family)